METDENLGFGGCAVVIQMPGETEGKAEIITKFNCKNTCGCDLVPSCHLLRWVVHMPLVIYIFQVLYLGLWETESHGSKRFSVNLGPPRKSSKYSFVPWDKRRDAGTLPWKMLKGLLFFGCNIAYVTSSLVSFYKVGRCQEWGLTLVVYFVYFMQCIISGTGGSWKIILKAHI